MLLISIYSNTIQVYILFNILISKNISLYHTTAVQGDYDYIVPSNMMQPYHDAEVLTKILNDAESTPTSLEYGIEVMSKYDHFDSIDVHTSIVNCIL